LKTTSTKRHLAFWTIGVAALAASSACEEGIDWTDELTVTIVSPADLEFVRERVPVIVEAEPLTEIVGVEFSIDPGSLDFRYDTDIVAPWESILDTGRLSDGAHELAVLAVGRNGETAEASQRILVDNLYPEVEIISPAPRDTAFVEDGVFPFVVRATDGSGIESISMVVEGEELIDVTQDGDLFRGTIDLTPYAGRVGSSMLFLDLFVIAIDSYERHSAAETTLAVARRMRWQRTFPSPIPGPIVISPGGNAAYLVTMDGIIYGMDPRTGGLLCESGPGAEVFRGPAVFPDGTAVCVGTASGLRAISAAPACTDLWTARPTEVAQGTPHVHPETGIVYFTTREGGLHAANAAGEVLWTRSDVGLIRSGPTVAPDHGLVIVAADDHFVRAIAIDSEGMAAEGFRWTAETGGPLEAAAAVDRTRLYVGSSDFNVYAFNVTDGTRIWDAPFATMRAVTSVPFIDLRGDVYVTNRDAKLFRLSPERELIWTYEVESEINYSGPVVDERTDLVLFGEVGEVGEGGVNLGVLHAVDRASGEASWSATLEGSISATPTVFGGTVLIGTNEGHVYSLFLDGESALSAFEL